MDDDKVKLSATTDGKPPRPGFENAPAPAPTRADGQHEAYWVLSEEERQKGFLRPVRLSYIHVGVRPKYPLRHLEGEELSANAQFGYVAFEKYPESESPATGRYWTKKQLESGCNTLTRMGRAIAETYARDPKYYGATFCCNCGAHFPVGEHGEFVWDGTTERVGT